MMVSPHRRRCRPSENRHSRCTTTKDVSQNTTTRESRVERSWGRKQASFGIVPQPPPPSQRSMTTTTTPSLEQHDNDNNHDNNHHHHDDNHHADNHHHPTVIVSPYHAFSESSSPVVESHNSVRRQQRRPRSATGNAVEWLEHLCFGVGALLGTVAALVDWHVARSNVQAYNHKNNQTMEWTVPPVVWGPWGWSQLGYIGSTTFYLLDSTLHLCLASEPRQEQDNDNDMEDDNYEFQDEESETDDPEEDSNMAKFLFGLAALCDLISCLLDWSALIEQQEEQEDDNNDNDDHGFVFSSSSVLLSLSSFLSWSEPLGTVTMYLAAYLFFLSAVVTLWTHRHRTPSSVWLLLFQPQSLLTRRTPPSWLHGIYHEDAWWGAAARPTTPDLAAAIITTTTTIPLSSSSSSSFGSSSASGFAAMTWLGDVVFLVATLLDIAVAHVDTWNPDQDTKDNTDDDDDYQDNNDDDDQWLVRRDLVLAQLAVLSALLWLADSLLYVGAQLTCRRRQQQQQQGSTTTTTTTP